MKVYVLMDSRDLESSIYRVFSSFEAAHKFLGEMIIAKETKQHWFYIAEEEVHDS